MLALWVRTTYVVSVAWAYIHCYITKFGTQEQRNTAADVGVVGATIILIVLHFTISRLQRDKTEAEARADERARLMAEITGVIHSEEASESPASLQGTAPQTSPALRQ